MAMSNAHKIQIGIGCCILLLLLGFVAIVEVTTIEGNELGVHETWWDGVMPEPLTPKTYWWMLGVFHRVYKYDMSSQVYVMNDLPSTIEFAQGREKDSYKVQSKEGQDMKISLNVRWRLDPEKLISLHKHIREKFEEKILRPALLRNVKDEATLREAIQAYSGEGLVKLQNDIQKRLVDPDGDVRSKGIIVENFVIEGIELDPEYIGQIKKRQVAIQSEMRALQEEKAELAEAQKAKAEAKVDYERQVVAAERDKAVGILKAELDAEEKVIDAEATKKRTVLAAEAEKEASMLRADAIKAIGDAEAYAVEVEMQAYHAEGTENYVTMEVAKSMAEAFKGIKGYLPEDMTINLLSTHFMDSVRTLMNENHD
jgi:regulator of protease activity HflC (stomatin/prohibitin superfamily)